MKKKFDFKKLFHDDRFVLVLSIVLAIIVWFIVVVTVSPNVYQEVKNIPIDINKNAVALTTNGLKVVDGDNLQVDLKLYGERLHVGNLSEKDFTVTASLDSVTGPGTYKLSLQAVKNVQNEKYKIVEIKPSEIEVTFDKFVTKKVSLTAEVTGAGTTDEFIIENATVSPSEITITGPENEVAAVDKCVVRTEISQSLTDTYSAETPIILLDSKGEVIKSEHIKLDTETAVISVPVLKKKMVPVKINFLNVPSGFPIDDLKYDLSVETVEIAGPVSQVDAMTSIDIGYIDLKKLTPDSVFTFDLILPTGFINIDNVTNITVNFDMDGISAKTFSVSEFKVVNTPAGYTITNITKRINDVYIVGEASVLKNLSTSDIVAEIDLSDRELAIGQFSVPVRIVVPSKGATWAVGEYVAVVKVNKN